MDGVGEGGDVGGSNGDGMSLSDGRSRNDDAAAAMFVASAADARLDSPLVLELSHRRLE